MIHLSRHQQPPEIHPAKRETSRNLTNLQSTTSTDTVNATERGQSMTAAEIARSAHTLALTPPQPAEQAAA